MAAVQQSNSEPDTALGAHLFSSLPFWVASARRHSLLLNARHGRLGGWWKNQRMGGEWWSTTEAQAHVLRGSILAPFSVAPSSVSDTVTY